MAARAVWIGDISVWLENIPILLFSATQKKEYRPLNQLYDNGLKIMMGCR
jgi:hypothetical protein